MFAGITKTSQKLAKSKSKNNKNDKTVMLDGLKKDYSEAKTHNSTSKYKISRNRRLSAYIETLTSTSFSRSIELRCEGLN